MNTSRDDLYSICSGISGKVHPDTLHVWNLSCVIICSFVRGMCCSEYHKRISRCSPGWRRSQNHWCIPSNGNIYSWWVCFCLEETEQARQVSCAYMQRLIVCATKLIALTYATKTYALFCISQLDLVVQNACCKTKALHCQVFV